MFRRRTPIVVAVFAFFVGGFAHLTWTCMHDMLIWDNRVVLDSTLREQLAAFRSRHGRYADSLDELEIDWIKTPERRKMLLKPFYYENRGESYLLWWHDEQRQR
jgi:hypothetical protein